MYQLKLCVLLIFLSQLIGIVTIAQTTSSPSQVLAQRVFERITGVKIQLSDSRVLEMSRLFQQGKPKTAVQIALRDPQFTNVRARNFAVQLSNKSGVVNKPLDDMSALITGIIRDNIDFRKILTADFQYQIVGGGSENSFFDLFLKNGFAEYEGDRLYLEPASIQRRFFDLHTQLVKKNDFHTVVYVDIVDAKLAAAKENLAERKQSLNSSLHIEKMPEFAGLFTTRGFGESNYSGGTNRRPVEYVVKQFLCSSMSEIANNQVSDYYVGKDVSRFPGGDRNAYITNCKSCHTIMDSWRGAFAKIDYSGMRVPNGEFVQGITHGDIYRQVRFNSYLNMRNFWKQKNTSKTIDTSKYVITSDSNQDDKFPMDLYFRLEIATYNSSRFNTSNGVVLKMTPSSNEQGYTLTDNTFVNLASDKYGWRGPYSQGGKGLNQFGQMIADSKAFSQCMVSKIFKEVCYRDLKLQPARHDYWTSRFENINYQMRTLIGEMVIHPDCGLISEGQK